MTCRALNRKISLFFDGRLTESEAAKVQQHLQSCAACQREWTQTRDALELLTSLPTASPRAGGKDRLLAAISAPPQRSRASWIVRPAFALGALGIGALAALALWHASNDLNKHVATRPPSSVRSAPANTSAPPTADLLPDKPTISQEAHPKADIPPQNPIRVATRQPRRTTRTESAPRRTTRPETREPVAVVSLEPDPELDAEEVSFRTTPLSSDTAIMVSEGLGPLVAAARETEDPLEWLSDIDTEDWL